MLPILTTIFHIICFFSIGSLVARFIIRRGYAPKEVLFISSVAAVSFLYLVVFFVFIINIRLGYYLTASLYILGIFCFVYLIRQWAARKELILSANFFIPLIAIVAIMILFSTMSFGCKKRASLNVGISNVTNCYVSDLPIDNSLPFLYANNIVGGHKDMLVVDWKLTDRTPVQVGSALTIISINQGQTERYLAYNILAIYLQLTWIAALWSLLRLEGIAHRSTLIIIAIIAFSSFIFINSVFVWPKLYSSALVILGFALLFTATNKERIRYLPLAIAAISLGVLIHTGVMFTILAMIPLYFYVLIKNRVYYFNVQRLPFFVAGALVALLLLMPWIGYKARVNPNDRLIKWHFAGITDAKDNRSTVSAIAGAYKSKNFSTWIGDKYQNIYRLVMPYPIQHTPKERNIELFARWVRVNSFFVVSVAIGVINIGWLTLLGGLLRHRRALTLSEKMLFLVPIVSLLFWVILMFIPGSTILHQGSYASIIILMSALSVVIDRYSARLLKVLLFVQVIIFCVAWLLPISLAYTQNKLLLIFTPTYSAILIYGVLRLPKEFKKTIHLQ